MPRPAANEATEPTEREWAFLAEYQIEPNATRAYQRAFPKANAITARTQAARLLAKPYIRARLRKLRNEQEQRTQVTADRVIREWAFIAFADFGDIFDFTGPNLKKGWVRLKPGKTIPPSARRAIVKLKVTPVKIGKTVTEAVDVQLHSKTDALDKLSRHLGLYKDLPPLETILGLLPPALAAIVRGELAKALPDGGGAGGVDAGADGREQDVTTDPHGPDYSVSGDELDPGPVAGEVPAIDLEADGGVVLPSSGEDGDERGEELGALFGP